MRKTVRLILIRVARPHRQRPLVRELEHSVQEGRLVLVRIAIIRDEVPQQPAVRERIEIRRVVSPVVRLVIEDPRRPVQPIRNRRPVQPKLTLELAVLLLIVSLRQAEWRQIAVIDPVRLIAFVRQNQLRAQLVREAIIHRHRQTPLRQILSRIVLLPGDRIRVSRVVGVRAG